MTEFEKNQIKRQTINDQLPLKLMNYLDYEEHLIKQAFTTKSRFILPKSQQKVFPVDDQFASAFTQLTLDEKVNYYSKQITFLKQLLDFNGAMFETESQPSTGSTTIKCRVKGKGLGIQWHELTITAFYQNCTIQIPHKLGVYRPDLHDYLIRQSADQDRPEIVLDAIRPNIIKYWRFVCEDEEEHGRTMKLLTTITDKALKERLKDDLRNFQQSRVMSKSTLRKRSQNQIIKQQSLLDASKFSSQVIEVPNQPNWPEQAKNKKVVNFRTSQTHIKQLQKSKTLPREQTSIIDVLSTQFRAVSPPLDYEKPEPPNLFDAQQDWFIRIMSQGYICSNLYEGIEPDVVLNINTSYKTLYDKNNNKVLQHNNNPRCFKLITSLKFPKDLVLSAFCEVEKWPVWNKSVEEASVKLRVPTSNLLVCRMKMKPLSFKYRPRQFLFMMHFFNKNNEWYLMMTSIKDGYHPATEDDIIRAKLSRCLVRLKENTGMTTIQMMIDIKQFGQLNLAQEAQLTEKFLFGFFDLASCLKDRIFLEAKPSKYFDLKWSCDKFSRFTLGKNNDLDDTQSFTSNLCSEICSFYSAEGPEDYGDLNDFNTPTIPPLDLEERQYSFKKKKIQESMVGHAPPFQEIKPSKNKLPFDISIQNNRVVLNQETKQKIEAYIREKEEERLRLAEHGGLPPKPVTRRTPENYEQYASKLPLPSPVQLGSKRTSSEQKHSEQKISSYIEMQEVRDSRQILKPNPVVTPQEAISVSGRKSSFSNIRGSALQSNARNSKASEYDIFPVKKAVSKIDIDKYNPDDHIVPTWEPKVYPNSGLSILSDEYLEKWVSVYPINVKKIRPYKGDNWDHYLFRDLWTVSQTGELICVNQQKLDAQSSAIKLVLKRFASNVMSGKGILNVSLPVEIFSQLSCLELIARSLCFAPHFLEKAAVMDDPIERFKIVNGFSLATSILYIQMQKPFNPILGQTYQGWVAGCPIYCQQISHHPPISAFYFVGRGFTVSGRLQPTIDLSLNSGVGWNEGEFTIKFDKYPEFFIRTQSPPGQITGLAYGDRKLNFTGRSYSYDNTGLFCQFIFNPTKKGMLSFGKQQKQSDYMKGALVRVNPSFLKKYRATSSKKRDSPSAKQIIQKICDAEGRWTVGLSFGGVEYFNVLRDQPSMLEQEKYPLCSHSNYREDIHYRRCQNYELAQSHKERLEVLQRNDKKLRSKDGH